MNRNDAFSVEQVMITAVTPMRESDPVSRLRSEMKKARVKHVAIVDECQHVVGIVSEKDLAGDLPHGARAGDVMTRHVVTVRLDEATDQAELVLLENGFHALPVVNDGEQLVGIVTASALSRAHARLAA